MSCPRDLDEYTDTEIRAEHIRRNACANREECSYCGKSQFDPPCRFPDRHRTRVVLTRRTP
jgi:hypothetical protein